MAGDDDERNTAVIRAFVDASNRHDLDAAWTHMSSAARIIPLERFGLAGDASTYKRFLVDYFAILPDVTFTIDRLVAVDGQVWLQYLIAGTHEAPFHGIPATHKRIEYRQIAMYRLQGGLITELDVVTDDFTVFKQLGAFPPAAL